MRVIPGKISGRLPLAAMVIAFAASACAPATSRPVSDIPQGEALSSGCELMRDPRNNADFVLSSADTAYASQAVSVEKSYLRGSVSEGGASERPALLLYLSPVTMLPIAHGRANAVDGGSLKLGFEIPLRAQAENVTGDEPLPGITAAGDASGVAANGAGVGDEATSFAGLVPDGLDVLREVRTEAYYYAPDKGVLIRCVGRAIPSGADRCYQKANHDSLTSTISYDLSLLSDWASIDARTRELLDCART